MGEIIENCPLCGSPQKKEFDRRDFKGFPVVNQICRGCGLVFQSPRMTGEELDDFYEREYRQLYQGAEGPNRKDTVVQTRRAASLVSFIEGDIPALERVLDIGCSTGILLETIQDRYHCPVVGVEPGDAYREYARKKGLKVYPALQELEEREDLFSLASLGHVLEHLPDPVQSLTQLRLDFLAPEGWLLIEVPNLYFHDSFEVAHLISFSPHTLRETLTQAGFEIVKQRTHGHPASDLFPLYITVLARAIVESQPCSRVSGEQGVRIKRALGMMYRKVVQRIFPWRAWLRTGEEERT